MRLDDDRPGWRLIVGASSGAAPTTSIGYIAERIADKRPCVLQGLIYCESWKNDLNSRLRTDISIFAEVKIPVHVQS